MMIEYDEYKQKLIALGPVISDLSAALDLKGAKAEIDKLEAFRDEAFQFAVDKGYDHPDYTDWVWPGVNTANQGAVTATAATAGDNE